MEMNLCVHLQRAFRVGVSTRLDDRVYALEQCKSLPVSYLIQMLYPDLYPVHTIMEVVSILHNFRKRQGGEWLALRTLYHEVPCLNLAIDVIQLMTVWCFIAQSLSFSPFHCLDII